MFADSFKITESVTPSPIFPEPIIPVPRSSKSFYRDVTYGGNHCLKDPYVLFCCEQGFEASDGWDPVSGKYMIYLPLVVFLCLF